MTHWKNVKLKRLWRPENKLKPKSKDVEEDLHVHHEEGAVVNPMSEFFADMEIIRLQSRDPNLRNKPSYDIGGPVFQNYLLWLQLSELMKLNKKIDRLLEK